MQLVEQRLRLQRVIDDLDAAIKFEKTRLKESEYKPPKPVKRPEKQETSRPESKYLSMRDLLEMTQYSQSTIYELMSKDKFPKQFKIGERAVRWHRFEIEEWFEEKLSKK